MSSMTRRLKGCKETITRRDGRKYKEEANDSEFLQRCWAEVQFHPLGCALIYEACARFKVSDSVVSEWIELMDELDNTGKQLMSAWVETFPEAFRRDRSLNRLWTDLFISTIKSSTDNYRFPPHTCTAEGIAAIFLGPFLEWHAETYIKAKAQEGTLSSHHLERLFLCTICGPERRLETRGIHTWKYSKLGFVDFFLGLGIDPNVQHEVEQVGETENRPTTTVLRSPWMLCLEHLRKSSPDNTAYLHESCVSCQSFVDHGADLQICWSEWTEVKAGCLSKQTLSPSSIFTEKIDRIGQYSQSTDEDDIFFIEASKRLLTEMVDLCSKD